MRNRHKTFLLLILSLLPAAALGQSNLAALLENRQYFELRKAVAAERTATPESLFYRALVANRFNRLDESIPLMERYLKSGETANLRKGYEIQADNYLKTFQYGKAADVYQLLLDRFGKTVEKEERDGYENSRGLWGALRNVPAQSVVLSADAKIQGKRDQANLLNVPIEVNGQAMDFVFDTGANLSTITVSTAQKLGLTLIDTNVSVGSSSNIKVKSKLAVAPQLKLGGAVVKNVVFLVLDDKSLYFPQINYQIHGIVGFPVMESIGRITVARDDQLVLSAAKTTNTAEPNMCLEDLKPLVQATVNGKDQIYMFDTGAVSTTFYPPFFAANKQAVVAKAKQQKMSVGGAGGAKQVTAYVLPTLEMAIGGKTATFNQAKILSDSVNEESKNLYGNLGQDLIKQFARMTLDFRAMRLEFE